MISIVKLILESIDIYSLKDMEDKEMPFEIEKEDKVNFIATFTVAGKKYKVEIRKGYGLDPRSHELSFGDVKDNGVKNTSNLLNAGVPLPVCSRVFSFLRYYLDKYNITAFSYTINGEVRESIYEKYFTKHFSDYTKEEKDLKGSSAKLVVWTKN